MDEETPPEGVRVDKWLWAVRIFKTRAQATQACRLNQVCINEQPVKPSRLVRGDEVLAVEKGTVTRSLRVKQVLQRRVGANSVDAYLEDLTLPEVWEKARETRAQARGNRVYEGEEGGRPSKRDRRRMEAFEDQKFASD